MVPRALHHLLPKDGILRQVCPTLILTIYSRNPDHLTSLHFDREGIRGPDPVGVIPYILNYRRVIGLVIDVRHRGVL